MDKNQAKYQHLKSLSTLLDSQFVGPFGIRFGLDGLLGLIPVIGDFATTLVSLYIIIQSGFLGCGPSTLIRMSLNVVVENIIDIIPVVGIFFDFYWKANNKNIELLDKHMANPKALTFQSRLVLVTISFSILGLIILTGWLTFTVLSAIYHLFV